MLVKNRLLKLKTNSANKNRNDRPPCSTIDVQTDEIFPTVTSKTSVPGEGVYSYIHVHIP